MKHRIIFLLVMIIWANMGISSMADISDPQRAPQPAALLSNLRIGTGSTIRFDHRRGDTDLQWIWEYTLENTPPGVLYIGNWRTVVRAINHLDNLIDVGTGALLSQTGNNVFYQVEAAETIQRASASYQLIVCNTVRYYGYLYQTEGTNIFTHAMPSSSACQVDVIYHDVTAGAYDYGTASVFKDNYLWMSMAYHLEPILVLNSTYYNNENVRVQVYDKVRAMWIEQSITNIVLLHPQYKVRIYDKMSGELVFEDISYRFFTTVRQVTIGSVRITNHSPEPIKVTYTGYALTAGQTAYLDPNGDGGTIQWASDPAGTPHYTKVDDAVRNPNAGGDTDYIYTATNNMVEQFNLGTVSLGGFLGRVTEIEINTRCIAASSYWVYTRYFDGTAESLNIALSIPTSWGWRTATYTDLDVTQTGCDALQIRYTSVGGPPTSHISVCYMKITYTLQSAVNYTITIAPYSSYTIRANPAGSIAYTIKDTYDRMLKVGSVGANTELLYTPALYEPCHVQMRDQNLEYCDFADFRVDVGSTQISEPIFQAQRGSSVTVYAKSTDGATTYGSTTVNPVVSGINNILISVKRWQVKNYWNEPIYITTTNTAPILTNYGIMPYTSRWIYCTDETGNYVIKDKYGNTLVASTAIPADEVITYIPSYQTTCFISLADQRGDYLHWENFRLYKNGSALYLNAFDGEINSQWNITVKDRFNQQLASTVYTVQQNNNFIGVTITLHALSVYNQQEKYIHCNITKNPTTGQYWSEWIAPGEKVQYRLLAGSYTVKIIEYETGTSVNYSYTLSGDDFLLVSSFNTIWNAINTIQNVNTTIGNQITNVSINIDNDLSTISNQTVNIEILLNNTNSTLTTLLIDQNLLLTALNSSLFEIAVNQSALLNAVNTTIAALLIDQQNFLTVMNVSISQMLVTQALNITILASDIAQYYLDQMAQVTAINSTISELLITQAVAISLLNATLINAFLEQQLAIEGVNATLINLILDQGITLGLLNTTITNASVQQMLAIEGVNATLVNLILTQSAFLSLMDVNITNLLLDQDILLEMAGNITTLLIEQGIGLNFMYGNITTMLIQQQNALYFINSTLSYSFIAMNNSLAIISSELVEINTAIGSSLYVLNSSITYMQNNITTLIQTVYDNITVQLNQLAQSVVVINDTIYTQVAVLAESVNMTGTEILGNQQILLVRDPFLDAIYHRCLFAELLNWSLAPNNPPFIQAQIREVAFLNQYTNTTLELELKFKTGRESFNLTSGVPHTVTLPTGTNYRVTDQRNGNTTAWAEVADDLQISFGYAQYDYEPRDLILSGVSSADFIIAGVMIAACLGLFAASIRYLKKFEFVKTARNRRRADKPLTHNPIDHIRKGRET